MIYSSITPYVHMLRTSEHDADHVCLDFTGARRRGHGYDGWQYDGFGVGPNCGIADVDMEYPLLGRW